VTYREHAAPRALGPHFRCAWINAAQARPSPFLVLPDGCIDIIWTDGRLTVAGPDRAAVPLVLSGAVVGLRFQAGRAADWLGVPAADIVDARPDLDVFWGREARALGDWIAEADSDDGKLARLQAGVQDRLARVGDRAAAAAAIFDHIDRGLPLDWSPRTLRRRCHDWFGYGPKTLDAILRLQRFVRLCRQGGGRHLALAAVEAGYADQPHLSRETRRLCGLTPRKLLAQLAL
jgi:hypothetical protein